MICPNCKTNLEGGLVYDTFFEQYQDETEALRIAEMYGATKTKGHWGREISLYDLWKDRTVAYRCPDCNHEWSR
jgi:hypothetical protein